MPNVSSKLWRMIAFTVALPSCVLASSLFAQTPHATQYSYEHSNGLWIGSQDDSQSSRETDVILLDQAKLSSVRQGDRGIDSGEYSYALGMDQEGHVLNRLKGQNLWKRSSPRHDLQFGLIGNLEAYRGTTGLLDLDQQYSLGNAQTGTTSPLTEYASREGEVNAGDLYRLSPTADASVSGSHRRSSAKVGNQEADDRTLDSVQASLEQRWYQSSLSLLLSQDTLLSGNNNLSGFQGTGSRQNTSERIVRYTFPLIPRVSGSIGLRDIKTQIKNQPRRYRYGPEAGLQYSGENWNWGLDLRSLRETGERFETFGRASAAWRRDAQNTFNASIEKTIDLKSSFTVRQGESQVISRQQEKVVNTQLSWERLIGRHRYSLALLHSDLDFEGASVVYAEETIVYGYSFSELSELMAQVALRQTRAEDAAPITSSRRHNEGLQITWRKVLPGSLQATGGRLFVSSTLGIETFRETPTNFESDRVTLLLSLGQLGNF